MVLRSFGRGRPLNAPAAFIYPCQPIVAKQPPSGPGRGDKAKTQAYCDIRKLSEQLDQASEKNDDKMADELAGKIIALEKSLGPEYLSLMDGLQDLDPEKDKNLGQEIASMFGAIDRQCTR